MNQAIKIINAGCLTNQTPAEEMAEKMGPGPISRVAPFRGKFMRERKKCHGEERSYTCHCEEQSDEAIS